MLTRTNCYRLHAYKRSCRAARLAHLCRTARALMSATRKASAGILLYRIRDGAVEVFLVHPGGPYWARKDDGAWSIPKGEVQPGEDPLTAAKREFEEETGFAAPEG